MSAVLGARVVSYVHTPGGSRHGNPVRNRNNLPSATRRSLVKLRPTWPSDFGSSSSSSSHCLSVRTRNRSPTAATTANMMPDPTTYRTRSRNPIGRHDLGRAFPCAGRICSIGSAGRKGVRSRSNAGQKRPLCGVHSNRREPCDAEKVGGYPTIPSLGKAPEPEAQPGIKRVIHVNAVKNYRGPHLRSAH